MNFFVLFICTEKPEISVYHDSCSGEASGRREIQKRGRMIRDVKRKVGAGRNWRRIIKESEGEIRGERNRDTGTRTKGGVCMCVRVCVHVRRGNEE